MFWFRYFTSCVNDKVKLFYNKVKSIGLDRIEKGLSNISLYCILVLTYLLLPTIVWHILAPLIAFFYMVLEEIDYTARDEDEKDVRIGDITTVTVWLYIFSMIAYALGVILNI